MVEKKYYWLKLHRDFFKRHDIQIIEAMDNGLEYILFYMKLLTESVDHNGELRFSELIPYDIKMLSVITNTNVDIARSALKIFTEIGMMETWSNGTIFMSKIDKMIGSETGSAGRVRRFRERKALQCNTPVTISNQNVNTELEIELEIDKEKEKSIKKDTPPPPPKGAKRSTLHFNFIEDPEWKRVYKEWAQNKKSPYRKQLGLEKGFTHLKNISSSDIETARRIIDHSLANNWAGLFVPEDIQDEAEAKRLKEFLDDI